MPYVREGSASPPRRHLSLSPDPNDPAGPSKKPRMTTTDIHKRQLEKLFDNPDKEIQLPLGAKERSVRAPREMMKNVQGSSAGAGSGEFHVYKQARRREAERLRIMTDQQRALDDQAAFKARQDAREAEAEAKTAKNRSKRQKRKAGKKGTGPQVDGTADGKGGGGEVKRKLAGGAGVVFKRPGASDDDEEEDEGDEGEGKGGEVEPLLGPGEGEGDVLLPVRVVEEKRILIHDDD